MSISRPNDGNFEVGKELSEKPKFPIEDVIQVVRFEEHDEHAESFMWAIDEMIALDPKMTLTPNKHWGDYQNAPNHKNMQLFDGKNEKGYGHPFSNHYGEKYSETNRIYEGKFKELLKPYLQRYAEKFYCNIVTISRVWFSRYRLKNGFGWHTHAGVNMSGVYLLDMPDYCVTEFKIDMEIPAKEGDLILFPSSFIHRCPPVYEDGKTAIVFSWDMHYLPPEFEKNWKND
tara:strand:+ start:384 stop:1073 length:690 start_codon:yes stop_codon:yes gene_type:complete